MEKKIRVIHIDTEKGWRGGQQQAIYLHEGLIKRGIESLFICNPNSALYDYCIKNSLPFETIRMRNEADVIAGRKIAKIISKHDQTIIHCHSAHALSIGLIVKYLSKSSILIGVRRVDFNTRKNILSRWKYNNSNIDKIICISEKIKNVLIEDGINPTKLRTIHSGIDVSKFNTSQDVDNIKSEFGIKDREIIVGTIAAFVGHKDYYNLIDAAKLVLDKNISVKFLCVGDGELLHEIKSKALQLGLEKSIIFTGYRTDIGSFLKLFDVFVLASKKEGLGTSILDAQSAGLPVISTRTGGIPEIIIHNKNGLLVEPGNSSQLAEAITYLLKNSDKRMKLGEAALEFVKEFDINKTVNKNIELYKELIGK